MELVILLSVLIGLGIAANRWGCDSRESAQSAEAWLAARGYAWSERAAVFDGHGPIR